MRSPVKGGGTRNGVLTGCSSSMGAFGGRGGGAGHAFVAPDNARTRPGRGGPPELANLPASASGGGARNLGSGVAGSGGDWGGESLRFGSGEDVGDGGRPLTGLRDGGGAGGGPLRLDMVAPVICGLSFGGAADGAGGGGIALLFPGVVSAAALAPSAACLCST